MRPLLQVRQRLGKHTELINRRTLITLALVTCVLLWLLRPNNTLLLNLLAQSEDPSVAIAFISVLQNEQASPGLDALLAKQLYRTGHKADALARLQPLSKFDDTPYWLQAHQLYAQILLNLSAGQKDAKQQLQHYLAHLPGTLPDAVKLQLAEYAEQINQPALALEISQHLAAVSVPKLLQLALAAEQPAQAALYAGKLYQAQPDQANVLQWLPLLETIGRGSQALKLAEKHLATQSCDAGCLQYFIGVALRNDAAQSALAFAEKKLSITNTTDDFMQAANLAESVNALALATRYLEQVRLRSPSKTVLQKLHQYYRWQQQTAEALKISRLLVQYYPDEITISLALADAMAQSDLAAKADFYYALAQLRPLSDAQLWQFVDANDKAYGAEDTVTKLLFLRQSRYRSPRLDAQLARFYQFTGQPEKTVALWPAYYNQQNTRFDEVQWFARAFNSLGQPAKALAVLHEAGQQRELSTSQLEEMLDLASYTANVPLQRYYQQQLLLKPDNVLDPYQAVASHNAMTASDQAFLWQLYQQQQALNILAALINHAINSDDAALLSKTATALNNHKATKPEVRQLKTTIALYLQDYTLAEQLIKAQLREGDVTDSLWQSAAWLALIIKDHDWLSRLYPRLLRQRLVDADHFRLLGAMASALGRHQEAEYWQHKLAAYPDYNARDRLNHALLAEAAGNLVLAQQLRWQVVSSLSQELQNTKEGQLSYQSLMASFISPAAAGASLLRDLHLQPDANHVLLLAQGVLARNLAAQHFWQQQLQTTGAAINDSLSLALALAQKNKAAVIALAYGENTLTPQERAGALQQIGHQQLAWQKVQPALGQHTQITQRPTLLRLAAALHPSRNRALRAEFKQHIDWNIDQTQLSYHSPLADGQVAVTAQHSRASTPVSGRYNEQQLVLQWQTPWSTADNSVSFAAMLSQRFNQLDHGQLVEVSVRHSPRWQNTFSLKHNMPSEQSQNSQLYAREDRISWQPVWQVSRYNQVSLTSSLAKLETDFDEKVGQQWQLQLQVSEQLSWSPQWRLYAQLDVQQSQLATGGFDALHRVTGQRLSASDFLAPHYRRVSVGQQFVRGLVGQPGTQQADLRFLLDTALGYNLVSANMEYNASAGLGIRLLGKDELFLKANWQSADRLGQQSLSLQLGYYIDF